MPSCEYCYGFFEHLGGHRGRCWAKKLEDTRRLHDTEQRAQEAEQRAQDAEKRAQDAEKRAQEAELKTFDAELKTFEEKENINKLMTILTDKKESTITNNTTITNNIAITNTTINYLSTTDVSDAIKDTFDTFIEKMKPHLLTQPQEKIVEIAKAHEDAQVRKAIECLISFDSSFQDLCTTPSSLEIKESVDPKDWELINAAFTQIKKETVEQMNRLAN